MALDNTLSLFVDESGILGEPAEASRFYILGLVLHDQRFAIEKNLPAMLETWVRFLGWEDPWRRERLPTLVFWPGESHGLYI